MMTNNPFTTGHMTLIADSGSTKTSWRLNGQPIETIGLNPVRDSKEHISRVLRSLPDAPVKRIFFYGAGCISPFKQTIVQALAQRFPEADTIEVESDMLGAARALCGHSEGLVGILGTGSNTCHYDGTTITRNVSPLGYILGDEGSGAVLGRRLVGDLLKEQMPEALKRSFLEHFQLTPTQIIENVYRRPLPNRFLASLVPFLRLHRREDSVHDLLIDEFGRFFRRNVALYHRPELPLHLAGGVAATFQPEIQEAAASLHYHLGRILQAPIDDLVKFHQE